MNWWFFSLATFNTFSFFCIFSVWSIILNEEFLFWACVFNILCVFVSVWVYFSLIWGSFLLRASWRSCLYYWPVILPLYLSLCLNDFCCSRVSGLLCMCVLKLSLFLLLDWFSILHYLQVPISSTWSTLLVRLSLSFSIGLLNLAISSSVQLEFSSTFLSLYWTVFVISSNYVFVFSWTLIKHLLSVSSLNYLFVSSLIPQILWLSLWLLFLSSVSWASSR